MAQLIDSIFTGKIHGKIGNLMFRSFNGKTFINLRNDPKGDYWDNLQNVIGSLNLVEYAYRKERKLRKQIKALVDSEEQSGIKSETQSDISKAGD